MHYKQLAIHGGEDAAWSKKAGGRGEGRKKSRAPGPAARNAGEIHASIIVICKQQLVPVRFCSKDQIYALVIQSQVAFVVILGEIGREIDRNAVGLPIQVVAVTFVQGAFDAGRNRSHLVSDGRIVMVGDFLWIDNELQASDYQVGVVRVSVPQPSIFATVRTDEE